MKTRAKNPSSIHCRGSAVLIILVLLACMMALLAANSTSLHALKQELKSIDAHQQKKYGGGARP
jgi:type II secretory pathway component PulK